MIKKFFMKIYGLIASLAIIIILGFFYLSQSNYEKSDIIFHTGNGEVEFNVEVANTTLTRSKGLMNRENLPEDQGMLFVWKNEKERSFWMKNTLISLDMIFVSGEGKIVHIEKNVQPCKSLYCESYSSQKPAQYVVEINGGLSGQLGIEEGQRIDIKA